MFEGSYTLAQISVITTSAAAIIIPTAGPIAVDMYKGQCDPSAFYTGYEVWDRITKTLDDAAREVQTVVGKVTDREWSGQDREAFEEHMKDYESQLEAAAFLSNAIAMILLAVAWALFIYIVIMAFVAAFLAALLIFIAAESAVTLGTGYGPAVAEASSMVGTLYTSFWEPINQALEVLLNAFAAMLAGGLFIDIGKQVVSGNPGALLDLAFAQAPAIDVIWRGSLNRGERKITADLMSGGLASETTAIPGMPKFTRLLPEPWGGAASGAANLKGGYDTVSGKYPFTGNLINKDNDQVG
jgi:ABC-type multidrug transport system fused ATPase/permease subunit